MYVRMGVSALWLQAVDLESLGRYDLMFWEFDDGGHRVVSFATKAAIFVAVVGTATLPSRLQTPFQGTSTRRL